MKRYEKEIDGSYFCLETLNIEQNSGNKNLFCSHTLKICLVQDGIGIWEIAGKEYSIQKGDIFILGNNERRKIIDVCPPKDMQLLIIEFEPRFIWSNAEELLEYGYLTMFMDQDENFSNRIKYNSPISKEISSLINQIDYELEKKICEYKFMIKVKLLNILVLLKRHFSSKFQNEIRYIDNEQIILLEKTIDYINENYTRDIKLTTLSRIALMSPSKFSRLFKKLNGINMSQYIMRMRVNRAVYELVTSDKKVLDIAFGCGFNNSTNFYKAFNRITGKSPKDFRVF